MHCFSIYFLHFCVNRFLCLKWVLWKSVCFWEDAEPSNAQEPKDNDISMLQYNSHIFNPRWNHLSFWQTHETYQPFKDHRPPAVLIGDVRLSVISKYVKSSNCNAGLQFQDFHCSFFATITLFVLTAATVQDMLLFP